MPGGIDNLQDQPALYGTVLERLGAAADQVGQVERDMLQFQGRTFDTREIEDIVDDLEQVLGGLRGQRGVLGLLVGHGVVSSSCSMPSTPFIGVRSSWLIMARKSVWRCWRARLPRGSGSTGPLRLLFAAGMVQACGQVVDVPGQAAQFGSSTTGKGVL
jgi:hypothetical protein